MLEIKGSYAETSLVPQLLREVVEVIMNWLAFGKHLDLDCPLLRLERVRPLSFMLSCSRGSSQQISGKDKCTPPRSRWGSVFGWIRWDRGMAQVELVDRTHSNTPVVLGLWATDCRPTSHTDLLFGWGWQDSPFRDCTSVLFICKIFPYDELDFSLGLRHSLDTY